MRKKQTEVSQLDFQKKRGLVKKLYNLVFHIM